MQKIRTIKQTIELLRELDPDTAISERAIRRAVSEGEIPHRMAGNKTLLNFDEVCSYFMITQ